MGYDDYKTQKAKELKQNIPYSNGEWNQKYLYEYLVQVNYDGLDYIVLDFFKTHYDDKLELIKIIGILDSLNSHALTVEDANRLLFAPKEAKRLESEGCSKLIVDLIWECCELENIQSLIPDKLESNIIKLKERAIELLK